MQATIALQGVNPNPARITDAQWWLMEQLLALEPGSASGGIYAPKPGYHGTREENLQRWPGNYSIREAEDLGGPSDKAAAFDWTFRSALRGDYSRIGIYMRRILASAKDQADLRLNGWREFYGQANSDSHVEGWDTRHGMPITSDASHLWHIHGSEDRDKVESFPNKVALLSVVRGETVAQWQGTNPPPPPPPAPSPGIVTLPTYRPGSRLLHLTDPLMLGTDVLFVQRWIGPAQCGIADGVYGPHTTAGVRWYQRMRGITVDGVCGRQTFRQMGIR